MTLEKFYHNRSPQFLRGACPRGARHEFALFFATSLEDALNKNSVNTWNKLLVLPYMVLPVPKKEDEVKNLTTWVKKKITSADQDSWTDFSTTQPTPRQYSEKTFILGEKIEAKLADGVTRGALLLLTSDDSIAPNDDATLRSLMEKHYQHPFPSSFPEQPNQETLFEMEETKLEKAFKSFPPGSAGGLVGFRPQILKDLTAKNVGENGKTLLRAVTSLVVKGKLPEKIRPICFGAALTALKKNSGGILPIAVENTWGRLTSKILASRITPSLADYLAPHQLGVAVKGGAEAGAHAARIYFNSNHNCVKVFLKLDFQNAFNELRRDKMLIEVLQRFPSIFNYAVESYKQPSNFSFNGHNIPSMNGVQQGNPLGPVLFALTIHSLVKILQTKVNVWYLDDGTLADEPQKVTYALKLMMEVGKSIGLKLNSGKCELGLIGGNDQDYNEIIDNFKELIPAVQVSDSGNFFLLGAPLTHESIRTVLELKTNNFKTLTSRFSLLTRHSAFRASISTPRL